MSRKTLILLGSLVGGGLFLCCGGFSIIMFWVYSTTSAAAAEADRILALVGNGQIEAAYADLAPAARTEQTPEAFAAAVRTLGLHEFASSSWPNRKVHNEQAKVEGTVTMKSGATRPLKVELVRVDDVWRVLSISGPIAGAVDAAKRPMPNDEALKAMTLASLTQFNEAVQSTDFTAFHGSLSTLFKQQQTPASLRKIFQEFIDKKIDIGSIKDVDVVFDAPPAIQPNGSLTIAGFYPTMPLRVRFQLIYSYEHPTWKLSSINVRTGE